MKQINHWNHVPSYCKPSRIARVSHATEPLPHRHGTSRTGHGLEDRPTTPSGAPAVAHRHSRRMKISREATHLLRIRFRLRLMIRLIPVRVLLNVRKTVQKEPMLRIELVAVHRANSVRSIVRRLELNEKVSKSCILACKIRVEARTGRTLCSSPFSRPME